MKVFATLATILGVAYATPNTQIHPLGQMDPMRTSFQQHNIMPSMRMSALSAQGQTGPIQYHLQDKLGNFEYAFANQDSEKMEKGNDMSVRGRYAYIMSDGVLRRVEYIANNDGFHILQDNADNSRAQDRIKRSVDPDLIQTRMTSIMDSSSLNDNSMVNPSMYNMMMGQDMSNNVMKGNRMNEGMIGRNIYSDMMGRGLSSNMMTKNTMGQQMSSNIVGNNMMGQEMSSKVMGRNIYTDIMGHDQSSNMINRDMMGLSNMMGQHDMSTNLMKGNMIGQDMYSDLMAHEMTSNIMDQDKSTNMRGLSMQSNMMSGRMNTYNNDMNRMPQEQRNAMSQRMQIPHMTTSSHQFF